MRRRDEKFPDNGFEGWGGYMQAKISKLEDQFTSKACNENKVSDIFSGVSIFVNGFTIPSADELKELMAKHGGIYHTYQRSEDFVIASNLPDTKVKKISLANVVKPEWITDSISANRLLDYKDYLLYGSKRTQPQLNFNKLSNRKSHEPKIVSRDEIEDDFIKKDLSPQKVIPSSHKIEETMSTSSIYSKLDLKTLKNGPKTAIDPNFISEFYNNSRLHHISQLGACFKQYINDLRESSDFKFPACIGIKEKIKLFNQGSTFTMNFEYNKVIMHIDMDCFFVSVGLRKHPELRGQPVAVTHSKGGQSQMKRSGVDRAAEFNLYKQRQANKLSKATGIYLDGFELETRVDNIGDENDKFGSMSEIASCSYEARNKGIKNGMFMGAALRLCPELQTIPYDFEGYKEVAYTLYNTIAQYTLDIEAVSCDEMYVDCTNLLKELDVSVEDFATILREEIKDKTGCPCSTGFGGNRLQARLATKQAKPNGQFFLTANLIEDFMFDIKLKDLPGVGRQISQKLEALGHQTCGSLQALTLSSLQGHLGNKTGSQLFDQCRGRDRNPLSYHTVRKSVSAEVNYGIRFENNEQCYEFLRQLAVEVESRMQQFKVLGKCVTLKLMVRAADAPVETAKFLGHGFCDVINKSSSLAVATNDSELINKEAVLLCKKLNIDPKEMRGVGIQVTKLESLNNNQLKTKGAISKFLVSGIEKDIKKEESKNISTSKQSIKKEPVTPKKVNPSPKKKSPILGSKRRGRPPKSTKIEQSTSRNLLERFVHVPKVNEDLKEVKDKPILKEEQVKNEERTGLLGLPWQQVRELLRAWFDSGQTPQSCDIHMIAAYMREMVKNKNIDKLYILVNFFKRRTFEMKNEIWNEVFNHVLDQVQSSMMTVYGKKLWVEG
ncbi:DNA repair protein REV1 [Zerene cesonia]|uniref:DNA repair protein REV1 n=1 Tax=Zerene cesonia TaxID=33412 RepID=UPI0018E4E47E|nr:DNA repair protein REV1 [Zerene cesonia]XP_038212942.1 DNA repair protein REV1 [Zerene cesonia]XP_038212943.1 DNA repair protein REV1 [Zerene cesonia]